MLVNLAPFSLVNDDVLFKLSRDSLTFLERFAGTKFSPTKKLISLNIRYLGILLYLVKNHCILFFFLIYILRAVPTYFFWNV